MAQAAIEKADDNVIQNFALESSGLSGRAVRLGAVLDDILSAHDYPLPVAHLVAETITLTLLLSSMLKYKGVFSLQALGDGPISMLVADVTSEGGLRGCATFNPERLEQARAQLIALKTSEGSQNHLAQYLGKGHMAFTVDHDDDTPPYQGIVDLKGASLVDCVQHYFNQSEQMSSGIKMAAGKRDGHWRAGGIMLQDAPEGAVDSEENARLGNLEQDDWRRSMILMGSCTDDEFLDPELHSNMLLLRLFHEEGVRVFSPLFVEKECRCSRDRVENILKTMPPEDVEYMSKDGQIEMRCEFCACVYDFEPLNQ